MMNRHLIAYLPLMLFLVTTSLSCGGGGSTGKQADPPVSPQAHQPRVKLESSISLAELDAAIERGARYLRRNVKKNGQFVYEANPNPAIPITPEYNILRHAGTIYALAHYHTGRAGRTAALERAIGFLTRECLDTIDDQPQMLALWSPPEITRNGRPWQAKLGGAGLGLVAFSQTEKVKPGLVPLAKCQQLARFVLFMQKKDGSYFSVFYPFDGGKDRTWTSLYYPGEAALGLLMLYERDQDQRWLDAAARTVSYLVTSQESKKKVLQDHWILLTLERLLPLYEKAKDRIDRQRILRHARRTITMFLDQQDPQKGHADYQGSFTSDGLTNPTATRLEGMLASLNYLPEDETALRQRISTSVQSGIRFLLKAQYKEGALVGGMPRAIKKLPEDHKYYSVTYNRLAKGVRIDNVQHSLSAFLRFREMYKLAK